MAMSEECRCTKAFIWMWRKFLPGYAASINGEVWWMVSIGESDTPEVSQICARSWCNARMNNASPHIKAAADGDDSEKCVR